MKQISANLITHTRTPQGHEAYTFLVTLPRMIAQELLTHRIFSRLAASSRAIPLSRNAEAVTNDPCIPVAWQKKHKGMQGTEYIEDPSKQRDTWKRASLAMIDFANELDTDGVTKQICNRLLEPFMWHQMLITTTSLDGFFSLRGPKYRANVEHITDQGERIKHSEADAEIHLQLLAEAMYQAVQNSVPIQLDEYQWHLAFIDEQTIQNVGSLYNLSGYDLTRALVSISIARAARMSYLTYDGEVNYEKDFEDAKRRVADRHDSTCEHQLRCMSDTTYYSLFRAELDEHGWYDNYRGYESARGLIKRDGFELFTLNN